MDLIIIGMKSSGNGSIVLNSGWILLNSSDITGIFVESGANGINNEIISVRGIDSVGILIENSSFGENTGLINLSVSNLKGLKTLGASSFAKNSGTIKVNSLNSEGIHTENQASEINSGTIGLNNSITNIATGTDKIEKIIAKEITTSNGGVLKKTSEILQGVSKTDAYYKKYGAKSFMIDKVGIVKGTGSIRRDFFTLVDGETSDGKDWKTYSIAVFNPKYGGTYFEQYYDHIDNKNPLFPNDKVILPQNEQVWF